MTDTPERHAGDAEDAQVAPTCACASHCGPQCGGLCDPHAIRTGLDEVRAGGLLLVATILLWWAAKYGPWIGFGSVLALISAGVAFGISRHRG
ncbi:MAG TPA: hypothetical protein VIL55_11660 [Naasia sp.]